MKKHLTLGVASALVLTAAAAGPAHASPQQACDVSTITLSEASELARTCDLTGMTVTLPSGLTLVVPESGLYVTASNTSEAGAPHVPETSLLNIEGAIAIAEEDRTIYATSTEVEEQLDLALTSPPPETQTAPPSARGTTPHDAADVGTDTRIAPDLTAAAINPSSPKCTATTAYTLQAKWGLAEYIYEWVTSSAPSQQALDQASYGLYSVQPGWSPNTCGNRASNLRYMYTRNNSSKDRPGVTPTGCGSRDSNNVQGFGDISGNTLARTCSWNSVNGFKQEADIMFDKTNRSWHASDNPLCVAGSYDIQGVALHEGLHAVGLGHTSNQTQVMRETIAPCDFSWREMGRGDQNGLIALYPNP